MAGGNGAVAAAAVEETKGSVADISKPPVPVTLARTGSTADVTGAVAAVSVDTTGWTTGANGAASALTDPVTPSTAPVVPFGRIDTAAVFPPLSRLRLATVPVVVVGASNPKPTGSLDAPLIVVPLALA